MGTHNPDGNCGCHIHSALLFFAAKIKPHCFCPADLSFETVLRPWWHRDTFVTIPRHPLPLCLFILDIEGQFMNLSIHYWRIVPTASWGRIVTARRLVPYFNNTKGDGKDLSRLLAGKFWENVANWWVDASALLCAYLDVKAAGWSKGSSGAWLMEIFYSNTHDMPVHLTVVLMVIQNSHTDYLFPGTSGHLLNWGCIKEEEHPPFMFLRAGWKNRIQVLEPCDSGEKKNCSFSSVTWVISRRASLQPKADGADRLTEACCHVLRTRCNYFVLGSSPLEVVGPDKHLTKHQKTCVMTPALPLRSKICFLSDLNYHHLGDRRAKFCLRPHDSRLLIVLPAQLHVCAAFFRCGRRITEINRSCSSF